VIGSSTTAPLPASLKKLCRQCGYQVPRTTPGGKPLKPKINAVLFSLSGISMPRIACLLRVSAQAVRHWLRTFAQEHEETPEPTSRALILELDERWHDRKQTRRKLWIWKALDRDTGQLLDWECGRRDNATLKKLVDRLVPWDVQVYGTDNWATYASVIPQDTLMQRKATTHEIERHHGRQRHGCGRFQRKSIIVSQAKEMVDLTMALFAKFWVNGNQDELLSLLG
jgi:insertion element IS1 protein InsB